MESLKHILADDYCRTCLTEIQTGSEKKHKIFPKLAEKLVACTNASVAANDEFSNFICNPCSKKLNQFHLFQKMCLASLERFREILIKCTTPKNEKKQALISEELTESSNENQYKRIEIKTQNAANETQTVLETYTKNARQSSRLKNKIMLIKSEKADTNASQPKKDESLLNDQLCHKNTVTSNDKLITDSNLDTIKKTLEITQKSGNLYVCEICRKRFFVEHRLTAHKRAHDGLIPYPCPKENCKRGFKRWHCLNEHLKQHEGTNKWFPCEEENCERRYKHRTTLDMHLRRFHKKGPELKSFICEVCGKVFKSSAILNDHRFIHKDKSELPYACDQPDCKYRFSNREKLKVHLMRHAGIKNFECPHCGMRKTTRNELKIHINYHTLERTFPCRFCTQVCNSAGNLKVHIRTVHERAKDYPCRFCERSFAKPDTRKYHEMIHTGEKPHQCAECGKKFVQPAALRTHKKVHQRQQNKQFNAAIESVDITCT